MLGTETDGPGGNVSSGSDSYSWNQTLSDYLTLVQYDDTVSTLGVYSTDNLSMNDLLVDEFNDIGTDILGASDSILGGCDTYSSVMSRAINTSVDVAGNAGALVHHQRPSVDVLFESLAQCAGPYAIAALLTGMGQDGAQGMKRLHDLHAHTIAQNAGSSVVYGMARKAVELEAVDAVVPLEKIAQEILKALTKVRQPVPPYAQ